MPTSFHFISWLLCFKPFEGPVIAISLHILFTVTCLCGTLSAVVCTHRQLIWQGFISRSARHGPRPVQKQFSKPTWDDSYNSVIKHTSPQSAQICWQVSCLTILDITWLTILDWPYWTLHDWPYWTLHDWPYWTLHDWPYWTLHDWPYWTLHDWPYWTLHVWPYWTLQQQLNIHNFLKVITGHWDLGNHLLHCFN